jgi:lipopolysaccharide transport system ATP-binding protein
MTPAVSIENLGKRYIIGHQRNERYVTLRDVLMHKLRAFEQRIRHPLSVNTENTQVEEFWALQSINLDIAEGDCIGIIGRNGAGKSTLLKILSRITEPTTGRIRMRGRVASLLEVGTGFHPELSGRENIYLNGAVLGMTRQEVKRKFDEIVSFSGVEKFLDTPVKRYSSGMYVRLAFAVAAHLETDILIVDEVLAVGDVEFQKKCLGKMGEVTQGGRTVLFVSHNMASVQQLANRSVLLVDGRLERVGPTHEVIADYLDIGRATFEVVNPRSDTDVFRVRRVRFNHEMLEPGFNRPLRFDLELDLAHVMKAVYINMGIFNSIGARLLTARCMVDELPEGNTKLAVTVSDHRLPPGEYTLLLGIYAGQRQLFRDENLFRFSLSEVGMDEPLLVPFLAKQRDRIGAFVASTWSVIS